MLTKDLIRYTRSKDKIIPRFIDPLNPSLLELANQLVDCFEQGLHRYSSKYLQEITTPLVHSHKDILVTRGFIKLLMDRSKFSVDSDLDYLDIRKRIFTHSNQLLKQHSELEHFKTEMRKKIAATFKPLKGLEEKFYEDLAENSILKEFKPISAQETIGALQPLFSAIHAHLLRPHRDRDGRYR